VAASEDDIGDDGGSTVITVELPGWLQQLRTPLQQLGALYERFGSVPGAIFGLISLYLLNGVISILDVVAGSVLFAFDLIVAALQFVQNFLVSGFGAVGIDILGVLIDLQVQVAGVVDGAGPAGPIVAVGIAAAGTYVSYRAGRFVLALINPT
jgi:hypothetical protein